MSSFAAPRCRHIKTNGSQCGSPALRNNDFCFYHHEDRPFKVACYYKEEYPLGHIDLPYFEDAHSIQLVLRQVVQMVMQKRLEQKTANFLLYALQIASSNLKRMELEKAQPEQVVVDYYKEDKWDTPRARRAQDETKNETPVSAPSESNATAANASTQTGKTKNDANDSNEDRNQNADCSNKNENHGGDEDLPPGTIHACYRPGSHRPELSPQ